MPEYAYVYILSSNGKRLYIGVTSKLEQRIWEHKNKTHPDSFTAKYNINQLVYFEQFTTITAAIAREKELKGWLRYRKIALIVSSNPDWRDLSADWGKSIQPFREEDLKPPKTFPPKQSIS
ncbi:MAG TPA: GIY-YIG nuclease family protein [Acidobacteriaceae bacterium]|nr:GIY-YIG nuclease family protein [Acidobacteriaceae bacterium]